jgi:hypothetical protein
VAREDDKTASDEEGVVDLMLVMAFLAFFAMVGAWLVAPAGAKRPAAPVAEAGALAASEVSA